MATVNTVYDNLYNNIKNRFTVEEDNCEYTLGGYMLMKANEKKAKGANLPVAQVRPESRAISVIRNFINDKLTVKTPPEKDKTIKAFPFRTSIAACLSAILVCTVVFTYGLFAVNGSSESKVADAGEEEIIEEEIENN